MSNKNAVLWLAVATVAGCGDYNFTPIPKCEAGQVLTGDGAALKCVDAASIGLNGGGGSGDMKGGSGGQDAGAAQAISVPTCGAGKCLTGDNAGMLQCVDVSMTNQTLAQLIADVASLENRVAALEKGMGGGGGGGVGGLFVGVTNTTTTGQIKHANVDTGIASAAANCADAFGAGAHMCSVDEMYMSVATGKLTSAMTVPKSWVYAPSWNNPLSSPNTPEGGLADNCSSYNYPTNDQKYSGIAVEWKPSPNGVPGGGPALYWNGGSSALCNFKLPIACCK